MSVGHLPSEYLESLRRQPVTCPVGPADTVPFGYAPLRATARLIRKDFDAAVTELWEWRMHEAAGLTVRASELRVRSGSVVVLGLRVGPLTVQAPCRVVEVVDEPGRKGFTYGTLPGHPESGIERFILERSRDGGIWIGIQGYSRPAAPLARLAAPLARRAQRVVTARYLYALDHAARGG
ncbi:DUF1990 family protein [Sediminivirga luteola]|uniref:DUF1990 domain-containing protein n=1 Tax=Sediminivirga luteola TaxID=1774748 RepID=A0A8J2TWA0_9MICO|nr:DUF1990 domain-containing protein [Sediminivirga luteola]MCI2265663.1 DUF1990 domain-containing protein [Sediminivirga luteola]GGA07564.1 hypothetical protein GCM10011333_07870 [Sediminivirga luteola]